MNMNMNMNMNMFCNLQVATSIIPSPPPIPVISCQCFEIAQEQFNQPTLVQLLLIIECYPRKQPFISLEYCSELSRCSYLNKSFSFHVSRRKKQKISSGNIFYRNQIICANCKFIYMFLTFRTVFEKISINPT